MATLQKRKGKNNWEICYPLPVDLRSVLRTPALNRSLGTANKTEAKRLYPLKLMEVEAEVAALRMKHFTTKEVGDEALARLRDLAEAFRAADGRANEHDGLTIKDHIRDAMLQWLEEREHGPHRAPELIQEARTIVSDAIRERHRISELVKAWRADKKPSLSQSTQEEYERAISRFTSWCRESHVTAFEEVTRSHVRQFVGEQYQGRLGKTVNLALGGLGGVWEHAFTLGWVDQKPRTWRDHGYHGDIRIGTGERKTLDEDVLPFSFADISILLEGIQPQAYADLYRIALVVGGARSGEVTALKPQHVTYEDDGYWIALPGTKGRNASRLCPVSRQFDPLMKRLTSNASGDYLLPLRPRKEGETERSRNRYLNTKANEKRRSLKGIPNSDRKGVHSTRRLFIEMLEGAGVALSTAKLLVGHSRNDITFGRYSGGSLVDLRHSVDAMKWPEQVIEIINR